MNETIVKHLNFGEDAKSAIFGGIEKLTQAVSSTLGASGKCVILEDAQGPTPTMQNEVVVNQRILNFDGSVIADTYKSGFTDRFTLKEAILGLQEGLQLMTLGSRFEFVIPPELAWGKRGVGNKIGPNALMVFDVRLLEIE